TKSIAILHGTSKAARAFELWDKDTQPNTEEKLHLLIKDGWYTNESTLMAEIRALGNDTPLAFAYVAKQRDPELRAAIINFLSAKHTLDFMGITNSLEEQQVMRSMETRKQTYLNNIQELTEKICRESTILLAGGNKVDGAL